MLKKPKKSVVIQLVCWSSYIILEIGVAWAMTGHLASLSYYLLFYSLNIATFYFHGLVVMKTIPTDYNRGLVLFTSLLLFEIFLYLTLSFLATYLLRIIHGIQLNQPIINLKNTPGSFFRGLTFMAYGTGFYFLRRHLDTQLANSKAEIEMGRLKMQLLITEQDYLRSQINPHLLFNTLNFIRNAAKRDPLIAEQAIMKLSSIMSYALHDSKGPLVGLNMELIQVNNILGLYQFRFNDKLCIEFITEITDDTLLIPPIILLTLVENIFKHGHLFDINFPAVIEIRSDGHSLLCKTSNMIRIRKATGHESTGLKNIAARLEQSYPNQHEFSFHTTGNMFSTSLRINLKHDTEKLRP